MLYYRLFIEQCSTILFRYWTDDGKTDDKTRETSKPRVRLFSVSHLNLFVAGDSDHRVHELWIP